MQQIDKDMMVKPCVVTVGTFDGVHRGHQFVVQQVVNLAHERGLEAVVLTFPNHPLQVLQDGFQPQMLTLANEKASLLRKTGVDQVMLLEFTKDLAEMNAHDFMRIILKERLNAQVLMVGYDNHFGHDRKCFEDYQHDGKDLGIEVVGCHELLSEQKVSSTLIRQALHCGDVETAHHLLGYNYFLQGKVVQGFQNGRKMGFPTANLRVDPDKLIPENGAYLVSCQLSPLTPPTLQSFNPTILFGMLNVGTRPTLHNGQQRSIEVHLFDFDGDLYGKTLTVELLHHLRKEQEFDTVAALQQQLIADEALCRSLLNDSL